MDIRTLLAVLARRWLITLGIFILCIAAALGYSKVAPKTFESQFSVFMATKPSQNTDLLNSGAFGQQRAKSYSHVINSPLVLQPVIDKLKLDTTPEALAGQTVVDVPLDSVIINVKVRDSDPQRAAAIGREMISSFQMALPKVEGGTAPMTMSVVNPPSVPGAASSPKPNVLVLAGALGGLVLGIAAALAAEGLSVLRSRRRQTTGDAGRRDHVNTGV